MKRKIAIVDDEPDILELVSINLRRNGFDAYSFLNGEELLNFLKEESVDLIILDIMLPDMDGLEICKILKKNIETQDIPIIFLTAKSEEIDKIVGLEIGGDDYITKPFSPRELIARIRTILRRVDNKRVKSIINIGDILKIDSKKFEVYVRDRKIPLTTTEFKILLLLATYRGEVLTRNQILDKIWGMEKIVIDRTVDVHVKHLRKKLGEAGKFIKSVRGVGYKLEI